VYDLSHEIRHRLRFCLHQHYPSQSPYPASDATQGSPYPYTTCRVLTPRVRGCADPARPEGLYATATSSLFHQACISLKDNMTQTARPAHLPWIRKSKVSSDPKPWTES
jgi:hypothetical protein